MAESQLIRFCNLSDGKISPCTHLDSVLQMGGRGTKYQGVEMQTLINMKEQKFSRNLVVLKSGTHGKKGVVLNFCPFCRTEILAGALEGVESALSSEVTA